jgi:hypothetical protein
MNFIGAGIGAVTDAGGGQVNVEIAGGGGGGSWAASLGIGNYSGSYNPELSAGATDELSDALVGTDAAAPGLSGGPVHMHGGLGGGAVPASGVLTVTIPGPLTLPQALNLGFPFNPLLTGVAGARTSGSNDFDTTIPSIAGLVAELILAINDPANSYDTGPFSVTASAGPGLGDVTITFNTPGAFGNSVPFSAAGSTGAEITASGSGTLSGGAGARLRGPLLVGTDPGGLFGPYTPGYNRGGGAVDFQASRVSPYQIAAGSQSFIFPGYSNRNDHARTVMGGRYNNFRTLGYGPWTTYGDDNFVWGLYNAADTNYDYLNNNHFHGQYNAFDATHGYLNQFHVQSFSTAGSYDYPEFIGSEIRGITPDFYGAMEARWSRLHGSGAYFGGFINYASITGIGFATRIGTGSGTGARSAIETSLIHVSNSEIGAEVDNDLSTSLVVGVFGKTGATIGTNAAKAINGAVVTGANFHATQTAQEVHGAPSASGTRAQATRTPLLFVTTGATQSGVLTATGAASSALVAIANAIRFDTAHAFRLVLVARQENADGGGGAIGDCASFHIEGLLSSSGASPGTVTVHGQSPANPVSPSFTNGGASMAALTVSLGGAADVFTITIASNYAGGGTAPTIRWMAYIIGPHVGEDSQ